MDAHLAQLVRQIKFANKLAEQRAAVPEELPPPSRRHGRHRRRPPVPGRGIDPRDTGLSGTRGG